MPTDWTDDMDRQIIFSRRAGATWDAVAAALGLSRNTVLERGRKLGRPAPVVVPLVRPEAAMSMQERPPLPPGHPTAWAVICERLETDLGPYVYVPPLVVGRRRVAEALAA